MNLIESICQLNTKHDYNENLVHYQNIHVDMDYVTNKIDKVIKHNQLYENMY
jgi:hypothetical protein